MIEQLRSMHTGNRELDTLTKAAAELLAVVKFADDTSEQIYPEDIADIVKLHSKIATGAALIPIPGVDALVGASAIWTMYGRINGCLGISLKENILKTIVSGVVTNLASFSVTLGVGSALKLIPGIGTIVGTTIMLGGLYVTTLLSGWVYIKVLTLIATKNNGIINFDEISETTSSFIRNNKAEIKNLFIQSKEFFKRNKEELKLNESEKSQLHHALSNYKQSNDHNIEKSNKFDYIKLQCSINIAKIDYNLTDKEVDLLSEIIDESQLSEDLKMELINQIHTSNLIEVNLSEMKVFEEDIREFLESVASVIKVDNEVKPAEKIYYFKIAQDLGYSKERAEKILNLQPILEI